MNKFKGIVNTNKLMNYFRISHYLAHPELKISKNPKSRLELLMTMRDLRLWVNEYAPWSSRSEKLYMETEFLNRELNYYQFFCKNR
jgi:hypothetical protein